MSHATPPPSPPASRRSALLFAMLLLLSGFCGISYEVLYARLLGNLIGDQFAVSASILLTFLLGIGFGTLYAHRLWRHLAWIEAAIGAIGIIFALITPALDGLIYAVLPMFGGGLTAQVMVCFLLLTIPAFAIGCSLPLFAGYLARLQPGRAFARAYTLYNIGAAITALAIEFVLLRAVGLRWAIITIAVLNAVVAALLLTRFRALRLDPPPPASAAQYPWRHKVALALVSVASAIFQLLMIKMAECLLGPFRETFAFVLALVLLGIAVGAALSERLRLSFSQVVTAALVGLLIVLAGFGGIARLYASYYATAAEAGYLALLAYKMGALVILMGLPAMAFGSTIPALLTAQRNVARESGQLLFVSSMANAAGFLLMAFVLHRHLAYGTTVVLVAAISAVGILVYAGWRSRLTRVAAGLVGLAVASQAGLWHETLLYLGYNQFHSTTALEEARTKMRSANWFKGHQDVFAINWKDDQPWFFINGYVSIALNSPIEKLVGAFPATFAPRTDQALVLGLGSGATASAVGLLFDRTDAVEISPVVLENLFRMKDYNFDIEHMPGVRIIQDDGIHFVKTTDRRYSLIINTVTTPLYFSSSKLYTREFFESIRRCLTADGIYVTWMDMRVGERGAEIILKTLSETFDHMILGSITSSYYLILCSPEPIRLRHPTLVADNPTLNDYFTHAKGLPAAWIPYGLAATHVRDLGQRADVPLNTQDYPALEFEMARLQERGFGQFMRSLLAGMRLSESQRVLSAMPNWNPIDLALYNELLMGRDAPIARQWYRRAAGSRSDFEAAYGASLVTQRARTLRAHESETHRFQHAYALLRTGQFAEGLAAFDALLKIYPNAEGAHFQMGTALMQLGRLDEALAAFSRELERDPSFYHAHVQQGMIHLGRQQARKALTAFDAALQQAATADIHYRRAQALVLLGNRSAAIDALRQARTLDPTHRDATEALARLLRR